MKSNQHDAPGCNSPLILGLDIGTSGMRGVIVRAKGCKEPARDDHVQCLDESEIVYSASVPMPLPSKEFASGRSVQSSSVWEKAFINLLSELSVCESWSQIGHIVADATSSTVLLCDRNGHAITDALMYDDQQAKSQARLISEKIKQFGVESGALGANSTLAKVLFMLESESERLAETAHICHQIDFINALLLGHLASTDENNALKLGYDSQLQQWPGWVRAVLADTSEKQGVQIDLPEVVKPGTALGTIAKKTAKQLKLPETVLVHAGTTDSVAGFLASGASESGEAVTSLGSTIAIKLISNKPIFNAEYGIYSHKLGDHWLVGGASNSGGAVLLNYFSLDEIKQLVCWWFDHHPEKECSHLYSTDCYPLLSPGERFPMADADFQGQLPLPAPDKQSTVEQKAQFLLSLLQGLSYVEELGYNRLQTLGASRLKALFCVGGGSHNALWQCLRRSYLPVVHRSPQSLDAAYGVTRLVSEFYTG